MSIRSMCKLQGLTDATISDTKISRIISVVDVRTLSKYMNIYTTRCVHHLGKVLTLERIS